MTFQPSAQPAATILGWSPAQVLRLENEWKRLRKAFACHPFVQVTPLVGDPPGEFQVQYKVRTLAFNDQNVLTYITGCPIHIWLPPQFPHAPPAVRPVGSVFHPNITHEWIYLPQPWHPGMWLEQVVTVVGQLLAYQTWDPNQNANPMAMEWLAQNQHLCPIDPFATFAPDTDGGPAARLAKYGAEQLGQLRTRVLKMCDRLTAAPPLEAAQLQRFVQQTRQLLTTFTDPDAPQELRSAAAQLDEVVHSMQGTANSPWQALSRAFAVADEDGIAAERLAQALESMTAAHEALVQLAPQSSHRGDPVSVLLGLPPATALQPSLLDLRKAVRAAEEIASDLQERAEASQRAKVPLPPVVATEGTLLRERLTTDVARAKQAGDAAVARMSEVIGGAAAALERGRLHLTAAERVADWAEYAEILRHADLLIRKITQFGPDGIQTYTIRAGEQALGPFEYEQRLDDVAGLRYAVSAFGAALDLIDTRGGTSVAHVDAGDLTADVGGRDNQPVTLTVHPSAFNDDLAVQFEYLLTHSKERFTRLSVLPAIPLSDSWLGENEAFFRMPASRMAISEEHKQRRQRWKGVLIDLTALGRFKNRLATYFLLERVGELVPRVRGEITRAQERLDAANRRLAEIAARASRDLEHGNLIIPAKFAQEYAQRTAERDRAQRDIPRFERLLKHAAHHVRVRLSLPKLLGMEGLPAFYVIPPLAEHWAEFEGVLSNADIQARIENVEAELGMNLHPEGRPLFGAPPDAALQSAAAAVLPAMPSRPGAAIPGASDGIPVAKVVAAGAMPPVAMPVAAPVAIEQPAIESGGDEVPLHHENEYAAGGELADAPPDSAAADDPFAIIDDSEHPPE